MSDDPLQTLFEALAVKKNFFPPTSRYFETEVATRPGQDGNTIVYLRRRFVPQPERFATLFEHSVTLGERLDHLAGQYLGDAEAFWRICDANRALRPEALVEKANRRLRITLPEGIPGNTNA